jgi:hypothetical protein
MMNFHLVIEAAEPASATLRRVLLLHAAA